MTQLTLIVPSFAQLNPDYESTEFLASFKHLKALLNLSKKIKSNAEYHECLFQSFGLAREYRPSIAAITALHDNFNFSEPFCLRLDPIELRADLAAVYMYANQHFSVSTEQKKKIKELIQPLLSEYAMTLHTKDENRWYLTLNEKPEICSQDPQTIVGKDIINYLPKGDVPIKWQMLQTEIQMTLHGKDEMAPINSLWIWGEGEALKAGLSVPEQIIYADDAVSLGLAKHLRLEYKPLRDFATSELSSKSKADIMLVYDKFSALDSHEAYLEQLTSFEKTILAPALSALKQKHLDKIIFKPINGLEYELTRKQLYCFWKKNKPIKEDLCKKVL